MYLILQFIVVAPVRSTALPRLRVPQGVHAFPSKTSFPAAKPYKNGFHHLNQQSAIYSDLFQRLLTYLRSVLSISFSF